MGRGAATRGRRFSVTRRLAAWLLAGLAVAASPASAQEDRAATMLKRMDADGDGRISKDEWQRKPGGFRRMDTDEDGFLTLEELRARFGGGAPGAALPTPSPAASPATTDGLVPMDAIDEKTRCGIGRSRKCDIQDAVDLGLFETGLVPVFPDGLDCPGIDEAWAIDYSGKRDRVNYHGGIDMPAVTGTPIIAAADGTVVSTSMGEKSYRGIELIVRHAPADTGLDVWVYTQYAHFDTPPTLGVGDRVKMGQVLGPTGNTGITNSGRNHFKQRRPAIHYAVWYSASPDYAIGRRGAVIPRDGLWMDPNALYRMKPPFDTASLRDLPGDAKRVPIPVITKAGRTVPEGARTVWPYRCGGG